MELGAGEERNGGEGIDLAIEFRKEAGGRGLFSHWVLGASSGVGVMQPVGSLRQCEILRESMEVMV